jgi:hypothetical protein
MNTRTPLGFGTIPGGTKFCITCCADTIPATAAAPNAKAPPKTLRREMYASFFEFVELISAFLLM